MNSLDQRWNRLIAAARGSWVSAFASESAPHGFPTRVVALWATQDPAARRTSDWASMALSGCGIAVLLAIVAVAAWGPGLGRSGAGDELIALADPLVAETFP